MSLPKEPRQKMINIMYLVLTALLALNVSSEILNAFKTVDNSLRKTNTTVNNSTDQVFTSLTEKMTQPTTAVKAAIWQPKAKQAMAYSSDAYNFIQGLKDEILKAAGGDPNDPSKSFKEDNLEVATRIMIKEKKGQQLVAMLEKYKQNLATIDDTSAGYKLLMQNLQVDTEKPVTKTNAKKTWEETYFHMVPTVAALTILTKFQNDIKTSENKIVSYCHEQVGKVEFKFDAFEAIVGQNSKYFMPGQEIEITAGLGAFSKTKVPQISINGTGQTLNDKGQAIYKGPAGGLGAHKIDVTVSFTDQDGQPQTRTIPVEYVVGQANASIALDKMNVLYIGVDNPVTIAASGGGDDKVAASINNGSLTKVGAGKYIARVNAINDNTIISVNVEGKLAGQSQFRVRTIPEAQAYVGGKPSGENFAGNAFRSQAGVGAGIKNFPFELEYEVQSFTFTCDTDDDIVSIPNSGAAFSQAVKNAMNQYFQPGRVVTIDDIRVKGPDGRTTKAPSLVYYIK